MTWKCGLCLLLITIALKDLLTHIRREHSRDEDFTVVCGIEGCTKQYHHFKSFYRHVTLIHGHLYYGEEAEECGGGGDHLPHTVAMNPSNLEAPSPPTTPLQPLLQSPEGHSDDDDHQGNEILVCSSLYTCIK